MLIKYSWTMLVIFLYLVCCRPVYADNSVEETISNLPAPGKRIKLITVNKETGKKKYEYEVGELDEVTRRAVQDYLLKNKNTSPKDFKKMRLLEKASNHVWKDLRDKYDVKLSDDGKVIKDKLDMELFEVARKMNVRSGVFASFYFCTDDEKSAIKLYKKHIKYMRQNQPWLWKNKHTDKAISIREGMLKECRYNIGAIIPLLKEYNYRNDRKKFNDLMLRIIQEDQVDFDYMYGHDGKLYSGFQGVYSTFLMKINKVEEEMLLSQNELKIVAEALMTKHFPLFDFSDEELYYDDISLHYGVPPIINFSRLLRKSGLDELNDRFVEKFFSSERARGSAGMDREFAAYFGEREKQSRAQ